MLCIGTAFVAVILMGCTHSISIKTEPPGASVRLIDAAGNATATLGTTPLETTSPPDTDALLLEIERTGHLPKLVVVPRVSGAVTSVTTRLQPLTREFLASKNRRDFAASLNANLAQLLRLQTLILGKKKAEVAELESQMREQWNEVSLFHSLMGNHHYLQGENKQARERYERALSLDPDNSEARSMLASIR
jgi:tetratricopeptide (TPR) repeat protein